MTGVLAVTTPYSVPVPLMDVLQVVVLVLVAAGATAVVLTRRPARQVMVLSGYGLMLALLFMVFQAPDVTLSELKLEVFLPADQATAAALTELAGELPSGSPRTGTPVPTRLRAGRRPTRG